MHRAAVLAIALLSLPAAVAPLQAQAVMAPETLVAEARYDEAAAAFAERSKESEAKGKKAAAAADLLNAASCLKVTGDVSVASTWVNQAQALIHGDKTAPETLKTELLAQKGAVLALGKLPGSAIKHLQAAEKRAVNSGNLPLLADVWNDLGIALCATGEPHSALPYIARAESLAGQLDDRKLAIRCRQNHLIAAFGWWTQASEILKRAQEIGTWTDPASADLARADAALRESFAASRTMAANTGDSIPALFHTLTVGMAGARLVDRAEGFRLLHAGLEMARRMDQPRLERAALISLAEVYLDQGQAAEALRLLDGARELIGNPDETQSSQLELLAATCHHRLDRHSEATRMALERSIALLSNVRSDIARTQAISDLGRSFRERAGSAYVMLADYHLSQRNDASAAQTHAAARHAVETYKAWELQDFFRDDCVNLALQGKVRLDELPDASVGVLYVIPLPDRTEILLGHEGRSHRWTSKLTDKQLSARARSLRFNLESDFGSYRYLDDAEALYDELIRPLQGFLQEHGVKHLVFIPDGSLASMPPAALFDKQRERYLLEDYSISIAPSLLLTSFETLKPKQLSALLFGMDEAVVPFPALPAIKSEIKRISAIYPLYPPRTNRGFTADSLHKGITETDASIVHIACHGEFRERAGDSFLVASDQKIHLDDLENAIRPKKYLGEPVELLCLSACRTAAGDERAALGLAGAAVKSGSRSVLATLWYIDDASASEIMVDFHRRLHAAPLAGKAEALRQAQLAYLHKDPLAHPRHWAPFILIGNWK